MTVQFEKRNKNQAIAYECRIFDEQGLELAIGMAVGLDDWATKREALHECLVRNAGYTAAQVAVMVNEATLISPIPV